ncbi:MAG: Uma2 family endonuclease [Myxococcota bacterium]
MIDAALAEEPWTFEKVEELERRTGERFEFVAGAPRMMADGSEEHHLLEVELTFQLQGQLVHDGDGRCRPFPSNAKVRVRDPSSGQFRYPDLSVFCGQREKHQGTETLFTNPTVLFEIVSPSSKTRDTTVKLGEYTAIPSLCAYVVVEQERKSVTFHERGEDGSWRAHTAVSGTHELRGIPASLNIDQLYSVLVQ